MTYNTIFTTLLKYSDKNQTKNMSYPLTVEPEVVAV